MSHKLRKYFYKIQYYSNLPLENFHFQGKYPCFLCIRQAVIGHPDRHSKPALRRWTTAYLSWTTTISLPS